MATIYDLTPDSTTQPEGNSVTFTVTRSGTLGAETLYASILFDAASSPSNYKAFDATARCRDPQSGRSH
jgi:hypothetical protein